MKNFKRNCLLATAFASVLMFAQCTTAEKQDVAVETSPVEVAAAAPSLKIAFVDLDSLMSNYEFAKDINKEMMRKEEDIKMKLTEQYKVLQADQADFELKYKNNVYATPERAQSEYNRIMQKEQEIVQLEQKLTLEFEKEGLEKNQALREAINEYVKEYNKSKGYDFIITKVGENLLYANPVYNVTNEVVEGLNERYANKQK
ncbi:MAG: OmpH family outer membrane protein [Bacteroidaceae bacterium]|nr:OmpH family outer membrane protein [Bacteroidaceae bacterium]